MSLSLIFIFQTASIFPFRDETINSAAANSLSYIFEDISDSLYTLLDVSVEIVDGQLFFKGYFMRPISDEMGGGSGPTNLETALEGYDKFVRQYYLTQNYQVDFISPTGAIISLSQIDPSFYISPVPIWMEFDSLGMDDLFVYVNRSNMSLITCINITLNMTNDTLKLSSTGWRKQFACTPQTTYCVNVSIKFTDGNLVWESINTRLDLGKLSKARADCTSSNDCYVGVDVGSANSQARTEIVQVYVHYPITYYEIGFCLNTTEDIRVITPNKMRVRDLVHNITRTDYLFVGGE